MGRIPIVDSADLGQRPLLIPSDLARIIQLPLTRRITTVIQVVHGRPERIVLLLLLVVIQMDRIRL